MGLFDKTFQNTASSEAEKFTQQEAFAGVALAVAGSDGCVSQQEWDNIVTYIQRLKIYDNFNSSAYKKLFDKLFTILKSHGPGALVNLAKEGLGEDLKLTAFACAVDIALADGCLEDDEKDIINELAEVLEIDEKTAVSIIEVMLIKNKC